MKIMLVIPNLLMILSNQSSKERYTKMTEKLNSNQAQLIKAWYGQIGKEGGKSTSEAKRKSSRENAKKAFAVRMANLGKVVQS
jgi:hypothetical protein